MILTRYFFIGNDLDELEHLEEDLEHEGIVTPQIHVMSQDDTGIGNHHHLHPVKSFMKKDVIHSTILGFGIGLCAAMITLFVARQAGWTETQAGWIPFIFLSLIVLGFFTWEGGLRGMHAPNASFERFRKALEEGRHLFFVDLEPRQRPMLEQIVRMYPAVEWAGQGRGAPRWLVLGQHRTVRFFT